MTPSNSEMAYSPEQRAEIIEKIIDMLIDGEALLTACAAEGMPGAKTIYRWVEADPDLERRFAVARDWHRQTDADSIREIEQGMLDGTIKSDVGIRVISSKQWRLEKLKSRTYGSKVALTDGEGKPLAPPTIVINPVRAADRD